MALNFEQIKRNAGPDTVEVACDYWGGKVRLRKLGAAPVIAIGRKFAVAKKDDDGNLADPNEQVEFFALLLSNAIVNDEGMAEMLNAEGQDFLKKQPLSLLTSLGVEAMKLNGMLGSAVEDAEKNLPVAPIGSLPTD